MLRKALTVLIVVALLSHSFLLCEGPRGPLCDPFRPSVENHIWFWWPEGIAGFEFDDNGNLLYIVDGIPAKYGELITFGIQKEFQMLSFSGYYTYWHPVKKGGLGGFWLKHHAVKVVEQPWGTVYPGVDFEYILDEGKHITEFTRDDFPYYDDQPFDPPLETYSWRIEDDELHGMKFDRKGRIRYLVHGVSGEYSLNDVPVSGEYTVWYPTTPRSKEGYWLKHVAIKEFRTSWGNVSPGVDFNVVSEYTLKDLTRRDLTGYNSQPFDPPLKNYVWKVDKGTLHGFQFDENGHLLYLIEGISGDYSLDDVPYSGEYTIWHPLNTSSRNGYWLKYTAVTAFEMPWGKVSPGIDYSHEGQSISDLEKSSKFTFEPFDSELENHLWKRKGDELYGARFDKNGNLLHLIHGLPGTYSLNDIPLSGEYVMWIPIRKGAEEGFWLKYVCVSECVMEWGSVSYGVDFNYFQEGGYRISHLTRDHYREGWDLRKILKYFWDLFN